MSAIALKHLNFTFSKRKITYTIVFFMVLEGTLKYTTVLPLKRNTCCEHSTVYIKKKESPKFNVNVLINCESLKNAIY